MAKPVNQDSILLAKDLLFGDDDERPGPAQPVSQAEIEDLLYSDELSADERLTRLRQLRDEETTLETVDFGDEDPRDVLGEINRAISRLEATRGESMDPASVDHNAEDHRETMSPDSDERESIEDADESSVEDDIGEVLDPEEREQVDGVDTRKGVR